MKPSFAPTRRPAFKIDASGGLTPPERNPNPKAPMDKAPVVAVPPQTAAMSPDQVHPVIEALCLGLCLAGENGDTEAEEKFNKALLAFTDMSYERGFTPVRIS